MGNTKVGMDGLENAILDAMRETRQLTEKALMSAVDKTARETVKKIKGASPVRTRKYAKGWSSRVSKKDGRGGYGRTVYNGPRYMLTHLLQNGHGGPRPAGAHPHIPSDEETAAVVEKNLESEMKKG